MAALNVGDVTMCQVYRVTGAVALVRAKGMQGVIKGPGSRATVGENLLVRVVDFDGGGLRFVAVRVGV